MIFSQITRGIIPSLKQHMGYDLSKSTLGLQFLPEREGYTFIPEHTGCGVIAEHPGYNNLVSKAHDV